MKKNKLFASVLVSTCIFGVHMPSIEAHQHSTPGEKVDDAIDYTKDKIDQAKDKTKEGIDKTKDGLDKVKDKIGN
jgi:hypothetical protein